MIARRMAALVGRTLAGMILVACTGSPDDPSLANSCGDLADRYLASHQDAIDAVEGADPEIPDGVDAGEDQERLYRINHIIGGLDWTEAHSEIVLRWNDLACEPNDLMEVLHDRAGELSYGTPAGEYLFESYFQL